MVLNIQELKFKEVNKMAKKIKIDEKKGMFGIDLSKLKTTANKKTNKIKYSEPADYFPKEIRDKFKGKDTPKKKKVAKKKK